MSVPGVELMKRNTILLSAMLMAWCGLLLPGAEQAPAGDAPAKKVPRQQGTLAEFMERKRDLAHEVFDALVLKDFRRISKNANSLIGLSRADEWQIVKTPRYMQYSSEFRDAAEKMAQAARDSNVEGAARAFSDMTLCCTRCHEYARKARN
jgi:hypothetical protein